MSESNRMHFITAAYTDIGVCKKNNQDSLLVMQAQTGNGRVLFSSVCDGMGGLSRGEVASASMVRTLARWFTQNFPKLQRSGFSESALFKEWACLAADTNRRILDYGAEKHIRLGTTCAALLAVENNYYFMNIGDSRIYFISDSIRQLTKDQTLAQLEVDAGRMTPEQARMDSGRNVLLQCIGASAAVRPVFGRGIAGRGTVFMLCSDGFRHLVTPEEFCRAFQPGALVSREGMRRRLKEMADLNLARGEKDNISAVLIKAY